MPIDLYQINFNFGGTTLNGRSGLFVAPPRDMPGLFAEQ